MRAQLKYVLRVENKRGLVMQAPLEMVMLPKVTPGLEIGEWEDLGKGKRNIDLDDNIFLEAIYGVAIPHAERAISEKQPLLERLPEGERVLLAYARCFYNKEPFNLFIEAQRGDTPERVGPDLEDTLLAVFYTMRLGWSDESIRIGQLFEKTPLASAKGSFCFASGWRITQYKPSVPPSPIPLQDPAVAEIVERAKDVIYAENAHFGEAFEHLDYRTAHGFGEEGITYTQNYFDTGLRRGNARLELFVYAHIRYVHNWADFDKDCYGDTTNLDPSYLYDWDFDCYDRKYNRD